MNTILLTIGLIAVIGIVTLIIMPPLLACAEWVATRKPLMGAYKNYVMYWFDKADSWRKQ